MRMPQLSAGVIRDPFTAVGRGGSGVAPLGMVPVCGDPCQGGLRSIPCPEECPCTLYNGSYICYKA